MSNAYKFALAACDPSVTDRASLDAYRAKRATWLEWLEDDEYHAIWTVLHDMVWSDVAFKMFSHLATEDEGNPLNNSLLSEALIRGNLAGQVLAIRRLLDTSRGRISLRRLLVEIRSNIRLFTRENYVCFDGDLYAPVPAEITARRAEWRDGFLSGMAHSQFDKLIGLTDPAKRTRQDRLPLSLIDKLEGWIAGSPADEIAEWSHAYLAHAGSISERDKIATLFVNGNKIADAIRALARVAEAIGAWLLFAGGRSSSLMPVAQFDQFEKLDRPVMPAGSEDELARLWRTTSAERDSWLEGVGEELQPVVVS